MPCARPSTRPELHPWSGSSSPAARCVPVRAGDCGGCWSGRQRLRFQRTPSASGRTPSAAAPVRRRASRPAPCPPDAVSKWRPSLGLCSAFVFFSCVPSVSLTAERCSPFPAEAGQYRSARVAVAASVATCTEYSRALGSRHDMSQIPNTGGEGSGLKFTGKTPISIMSARLCE